MTFDQIVEAYRAGKQKAARREVRYYAIQQTLSDAIRVAAGSCLPGGKRHSHQRRLSGAVLAQAENRLLARATTIAECQDFDTLLTLVRATISGKEPRGHPRHRRAHHL
jgi:hypothetical protein